MRPSIVGLSDTGFLEGLRDIIVAIAVTDRLLPQGPCFAPRGAACGEKGGGGMLRAAWVCIALLATVGCGFRTPPQKKTANDWIQELKNEAPAVRSRAALALGQPGQDVERVVEALGQALTDENQDVRGAALASLSAIGPDAADAVPRIIGILQDEKMALRRSAANALGRIGDARAAPALAAAGRDENGPLRHAARDALAAMGAAAVPFWIELLDSDDELDRIGATSALLRLGPEAEVAVPALAKALKDESVSVRKQAGEVLGAIGPEAQAAVPALLEATRDEELFVRMNAAWALKEIAPKDERTAAALREQLEDPEVWIRVTAAESLWTIGDKAELLVPVLVDALAQQEVDDIPNSSFTAAAMRQRAADALKNIGGAAVPVLEKLTEQETGAVQNAAAKALGEIEWKNRSADPLAGARG
jgi:HEAT repeat protein